MKKAQNVIAIFLFFLSLYVLSMGGHGYGGVGTTTYSVTRAMLLEQTCAIEPVPWGQVGPDGRFYAQYGVGHSLYNIPFYGLGHLMVKLMPRLAPHYDRLTMFTTLIGQPVISALTCACLFLFCLKLGYPRKIAFINTLLYGLGTQVWMYAQLDFSEPILTFFLFSSAYWLYLPEPHGFVKKNSTKFLLMTAGLLFGVAITVKVVALLLFPLYVWYLWGTHSEAHPLSRITRLACFGIPALFVGGGIVGTYNTLRFNNPLRTGYGDEFTTYYGDVLRHFTDNLWSLEGSIFLYSPVILLACWSVRIFYRRHGRFALCVFGSIAAFFLFYPFSTNELYYGPRYLIPTLPFWMLIAGAGLTHTSLLSRCAMPALLAIGGFQQLLGVVVNYHTYYWRIQFTLPVTEKTVQLSEIGHSLLGTPKLPHILGHLWLLRQGILDLFTPSGFPLSGIELLANSGMRNAWVPYYGLDLWWLNAQLLDSLDWFLPGTIVLALLGVLGWSAFQFRTGHQKPRM